MAGAIRPSDIAADRTCYRVWWPEGDDWYGLLIGAISKLYLRSYWAGPSDNELQVLTETVLNAIAATIDDRGCEMRILGEIVGFAETALPQGWAYCDGAEYDISEWDSLFGVLGYTHGGTIGETFRLPDLRNKFILGYDNIAGEFDYVGSEGGEAEHTLDTGEMPSHNHTFTARNNNPSEGIVYTTASPGAANRFVTGGAGGAEETRTPFIRPSGGGQAHNNMPPYVVLSYIIYTGFPG